MSPCQYFTRRRRGASIEWNPSYTPRYPYAKTDLRLGCHGNHKMRVRRIRPHYEWLRRVGVGRHRVPHCFDAGADYQLYQIAAVLKTTPARLIEAADDSPRPTRRAAR